MKIKKGGVKTVKELISKDGGTEGFLKLWQFGRLDLSIEALVQLSKTELKQLKEVLDEINIDELDIE